MAIKRPQKVLLHHIPLRFVQRRVTGHGRKGVNHEIPLIPFIDFLIVLVIFLLMSFSASGELVVQQKSITLPDAETKTSLQPERKIIAIDAKVVTFDGQRVADTQTLAATPQVDRIESLIQGLEAERAAWETFHSNDAWHGEVIVQADKEIDFRVVKKVLFSAAQAGYGNVSFAVNQVGGAEEPAE